MDNKNYGWRGLVLRVDLTEATIREEDLSDAMKRDYTGGAGINARLFFDAVRTNPDLDPLSPGNPLIFGCGPIVGTTFPCATRYTVTSKSPLTRIFGDSNAGGYFGPKLKQAGYDHIVVTGKSEKPVALYIEKGKTPQIIDAEWLWGLDTYATDEHIQQKYGDCETATDRACRRKPGQICKHLFRQKKGKCQWQSRYGMCNGLQKLKGHYC